MSQSILIVDDTELNIEILVELLGEKYDILVATEGMTALQIAQDEVPDMILLDIMMPDMDGFEVCRRLKGDSLTKDIPVIFITAKSDEQAIEEAYSIGGVDYITKPFCAGEVLSRVSTHLALFQQQKYLEKMVQQKTEELRALNKELEDTQKEIIVTLGSIAEKRSQETSRHVTRVGEYSKLLALLYGLGEEEAERIRQASPMHDIGKIATPDNILNKPAALTHDEFEIMKLHTTNGYEMLKHSNRTLLKMAAQIAISHHEKWDGSGYPYGLKGTDIPVSGRITALADVFDALSSDRVYKKAMHDDEVIAIITNGKGSHFEPKLVDIFLTNLARFLAIRYELKDA